MSANGKQITVGQRGRAMSPGDPTIRLVDVVDASGLDLARRLFRDYAAEFADSIAETLCFQGFDAEVAGLPGRYAPPSGCLLLAIDGEVACGTVALRDLGAGTCEMKRLYVAPTDRGRGVGMLLVEGVIRRGEQRGFRRMVLDTMPEMAGALAIYREFGFVETTSYWAHPAERAVFMERSLVIEDVESKQEKIRMGQESLAEVVQADMAAYFEHLAARVERLARRLSEEQLWTNPFEFGNSVGRIVVHLTGSLNHYIGAKVVATGYVRDRPAEFSSPARPTTDVLFHEFRETIDMVVRTLRSQGEAGLTTAVEDCGEPVRDRFGLFLVCTAHVSNHVGQIASLVQAFGHALDEKSW